MDSTEIRYAIVGYRGQHYSLPSNQYQGQYNRQYDGQYDRQYGGGYDRQYAGQHNRQYRGQYDHQYAGQHDRQYNRQYDDRQHDSRRDHQYVNPSSRQYGSNSGQYGREQSQSPPWSSLNTPHQSKPQSYDNSYAARSPSGNVNRYSVLADDTRQRDYGRGSNRPSDQSQIQSDQRQTQSERPLTSREILYVYIVGSRNISPYYLS